MGGLNVISNYESTIERLEAITARVATLRESDGVQARLDEIRADLREGETEDHDPGDAVYDHLETAIMMQERPFTELQRKMFDQGVAPTLGRDLDEIYDFAKRYNPELHHLLTGE